MKVQIKKTPFKYQLTRYLKMQNFLYQNNLYLVLGDGTFLSPLIKYKTFTNEQNDKILLIEFSKLGVKKIDDQLPLLENALVAKLKAIRLIKINNQPTSVTYEILLKESEQETIILDDNIEPSKNDTITLDKYHLWNPNTVPHCLIAGPTRSGKSRVAYNIIKQLKSITDEKFIFVIDPKNDELREVCRNNFKLKYIETKQERIEQLIDFYFNLMMKRFDEKEKGKLETDFKHAFLIIDELAAFKNFYNTKKEYQEIEKKIKTIAMLGRAARIHIIIMLQQPSAENLSTELRDQLGVRILMGNPVNRETFVMALGQNDKEIFTKEQGEGFISINNKVEDFKAPKILFPREIQ
jgi:S-DNA-T family DNA segregation ATPase FtsK/SpoIIIE